MIKVGLKYMLFLKEKIKKLDTWVMDQLYKLYPNLTKHMKK